MIDIGFVILHYNAMEVTEECIESILQLDEQERIGIVIVDNASPNGSGKILREKYYGYGNIKVLLRDRNDGFSAGNNVGCELAMRTWEIRFLVVANNDVVFPDKKFVSELEQEYEKSHFDIMGPDIYNPLKKVHQSPMTKEIPTKEQINKTIFLNKFFLKLYPFVYPVMKLYFKVQDTKGTSLDYSVCQENVCIMGACMIYARGYIIQKGKIFYPQTEFYYEENIQTLWCLRNRKKIVYQPQIQVWHLEGKATNTIDSKMKRRIHFKMKHIVKSAIVYRELL